MHKESMVYLSYSPHSAPFSPAQVRESDMGKREIVVCDSPYSYLTVVCLGFQHRVQLLVLALSVRLARQLEQLDRHDLGARRRGEGQLKLGFDTRAPGDLRWAKSLKKSQQKEAEKWHPRIVNEVLSTFRRFRGRASGRETQRFNDRLV